MNKYKRFALDKKRYVKMCVDYQNNESEIFAKDIVEMFESLVEQKKKMNKAEKIITFLLKNACKDE